VAQISWCLQIEHAKFGVHTDDDAIYCQQAWIRHFHMGVIEVYYQKGREVRLVTNEDSTKD
jgi:hypothetical protein